MNRRLFFDLRQALPVGVFDPPCLIKREILAIVANFPRPSIS